MNQQAISSMLNGLSGGVDTQGIIVETSGDNMIVTVIDPDTGETKIITIPAIQ